MLEIVENPSDKRMTADEAEDLVSEQIQKLGSELVEDWASLEQARLAKVVGNMAGVFGHGKKTPLENHLWRNRDTGTTLFGRGRSYNPL